MEQQQAKARKCTAVGDLRDLGAELGFHVTRKEADMNKADFLKSIQMLDGWNPPLAGWNPFA